MGDGTERTSEPISILCFGDANTWGGVAEANERRLGRSERWTGLLQGQLGNQFHVIEDGHPDRTTVWDDPIDDEANGRRHLPVSLACHRPLDAVILMLGSTDLRPRHRVTSKLASEGLAELCRIVLESEAWPGAGGPQLVLVGPVGSGTSKNEELIELSAHTSELAGQLNCPFVDPNSGSDLAATSGHLDLDGHRFLAVLLESVIKSMFAVE